jgi:predicted membrane metal-binding protein
MPDTPKKFERNGRFKSPLAALAACFGLGILWERWLQSMPGAPTLLAASATVILFGLIMLRANRGRTAMSLVLVSMTLTGASDAIRWEHRFPANHVRYLPSLGLNLDAPLGLTGRVLSAPAPTAHGTQFDLEVQRAESGTRSLEVRGKVRLRVQGYDERMDSSGRPLQVQFGDTIHAVAARLYPPHTDQNPGSFNYREWMEDIEDLDWVGTVSNSRQVEVTGHDTGLHFDEIIERTRQRLLRAIDDLYPPWSPEGRDGSVLKAV